MSPRLISLPLLPLAAAAMWMACSSPEGPSLGRALPGPVGLEQWIASEAKRLGAREFSVTRLQAEGDLDRDGRPDQAWVYRLDSDGSAEGFQQFLAVQISSELRHIRALPVGKSGGRSVSEVRVIEGRVELNTQEYLPTDQSCCPTGHATLRVRLQSGRLEVVEEKRP